MVRLTDRPAMTIAVDLGRKATKTKDSINKPRLCRDRLKMSRSSCADEIRVKVPSFPKLTLFVSILNIQQKYSPFTFLIF